MFATKTTDVGEMATDIKRAIRPKNQGRTGLDTRRDSPGNVSAHLDGGVLQQGYILSFAEGQLDADRGYGSDDND